METLVQPPTVSVIVPTFNRAAVLMETVDSVLRQTFPDFELIVVDDGSRDDTASRMHDIMRNDNRVRYLSRPDTLPKGANSCRNFGLSVSRGKFIKWLDSDDLLSADCLEKQVAILNSADVDVCLSQAILFHGGEGNPITLGKRWGRLMPDNHSMLVDEYLMRNLRWSTPCGLWRRSFMIDDPFLESLHNSQEWLMHLRMILLGPKIHYLNENLVLIRAHIGSMSSASNKKGVYYYHQCVARVEAVDLLSRAGKLNARLFWKMLRFILWNHLFIFYKGAFGKGLAALLFYPKLAFNFFKGV